MLWMLPLISLNYGSKNRVWVIGNNIHQFADKKINSKNIFICLLFVSYACVILWMPALMSLKYVGKNRVGKNIHQFANRKFNTNNIFIYLLFDACVMLWIPALNLNTVNDVLKGCKKHESILGLRRASSSEIWVGIWAAVDRSYAKSILRGRNGRMTTGPKKYRWREHCQQCPEGNTEILSPVEELERALSE